VSTIDQVLEAALAQHLAIVGKTGSGKTSTAKLAVEQLVGDGSRVCVLDPIKSDWWGVISSADGRRPGLPFHVLGGPRAHVALHSGAGAAIAELVARGDLPLSVLDMADFEPGGQLRFFVDFAPKLLQRMRGVLYLVLEEAHLFAPKERAGMSHENMAIHWAKTLATAGRSKGIRLIVATQRTQALHNAVLGSCDTLIAHRLTAPADQEPVKKWLKANVEKDVFDQVAGELASLKTGTAWLCAGEAQVFERIQFPRISTFDNSATPTEDSDELQVRGNDVDMDALRALIGTAVAEAEANDPKKLKARIQELEKELRQKPSAKVPEGYVSPAELERVASEAEARGYTEGALQQLAEIRSDLRPHVEVLYHKLANGTAPTVPVRAPRPAATQSAPAPRAAPPRPAPRPRSPDRPARDATEGAGLGKGERQILTAVAQHERGVTREQLSVLTGYKRSSRDTYLQKLRAYGYVETSGDVILATDDGVAALGDDFEPLPTGEELQRYWLDRLGGGERVILEVLIQAHPDAVDRDYISEATPYKRSSRDTYLQKLIARKLVISEGRGMVRASEDLF
jgi:hypothetical protein